MVEGVGVALGLGLSATVTSSGCGAKTKIAPTSSADEHGGRDGRGDDAIAPDSRRRPSQILAIAPRFVRHSDSIRWRVLAESCAQGVTLQSHAIFLAADRTALPLRDEVLLYVSSTPKPTGDERAQALADAGGVMTHRQILFIIFGLMAGMFLSSLDQTIVGTSMRTIADDLDGLSLQAWVTTAYLITSTIATPIYGKLSDIFGRRPLFIIAISIFLVGSILAGVRAPRCTCSPASAPCRASAPAASWRCRSRSWATSSPRASAPSTRATSSPCSASRASSAR